MTNAPKQRADISASYKLSASPKIAQSTKITLREANHPKHIRVSTKLISKKFKIKRKIEPVTL
jgi:hypothetical protein